MKTRIHPTKTKQFEEFYGKKILVIIRRENREYQGILTKEDPYFIYLKKVQITNRGKTSESELVAVSKHIIGEAIQIRPDEI